MVYDIVLTEKCNRRCPFCYVKKNNFIETPENIDIFINGVKNMQKTTPGNYAVNVFGGEPFMHYPGIKQIYSAFKDDPRCRMMIVTNGDLVEDWMISELAGCEVHISTYSIFNPELHDRYRHLCRSFKNGICLYTLTETDIDRYFELSEIYRKLGLPHHIHFSHDPKSWSGIDGLDLYEKVKHIFLVEFGKYADRFSNRNPRAPNIIESYVARFVQNIFDETMEPTLCVTEDRMEFYRGKFVGPCVRLTGKKLKYGGSKCKECKYFKCCTKSCFAEIKDDVDDKLCILEKARFDAIEAFFESGRENAVQIMQYYKDVAFGNIILTNAVSG